MKGRYRAQGFTLMEVLLVVAIIGLLATRAVPTLPKGSGVQKLQLEAERLAELAKIARQQALMDGQSLGLAVLPAAKLPAPGRAGNSSASRYHFMVYRGQKWLVLENDRILKSFTLPDDIAITLVPGDSFWRAAIEYEQEAGMTDVVRTELSGSAKALRPDLFFWSSGEVSPARIQLCLEQRQPVCRVIELSEMGRVTLSEVGSEPGNA